jgi:co-chaperonin GroES (HSP10)
MKLRAIGKHIIITRDPAPKEMGGFIVPDSKAIKPNTGLIISVGETMEDKSVKEGEGAVFNKTSGFTLEFPDFEVHVLREQDLIACYARDLE